MSFSFLFHSFTTQVSLFKSLCVTPDVLQRCILDMKLREVESFLFCCVPVVWICYVFRLLSHLRKCFFVVQLLIPVFFRVFQHFLKKCNPSLLARYNTPSIPILAFSQKPKGSEHLHTHTHTKKKLLTLDFFTMD